MTHLERRLARLETAQGNAPDLVECEISQEGKELLRCTLAGLHSPEEIERIVSAKALSPRRELNPALGSSSKRSWRRLSEMLKAPRLPGLRQP
jgi:hypothetical protein